MCSLNLLWRSHVWRNLQFLKERSHCHSYWPVHYFILAPSETRWEICPLHFQKIHHLMIQCIYFTFPIAVLNNSPLTERCSLLVVVDGRFVEFFHFIFIMRNWPHFHVGWVGQDQQICRRSMASVNEKSLVCWNLNRLDGYSCSRVCVSSFPLKSLL